MVQRNIVIAIILIALFVLIATAGFVVWFWNYRLKNLRKVRAESETSGEDD